MEWISIISYGSILAVAVYLIGFGVGRRSAYKNVEINFPLPLKIEPMGKRR